MQIEEYYNYSVFADLSYVNWISNRHYTYLDIRAATSDPDTQKGPEAIVEDVFDTKGWEIKNVQENDSSLESPYLSVPRPNRSVVLF